MVKSILLDLDAEPQFAEGLEYIEVIVDVDVRKVELAISGMIGTAKRFENAWRRIVVDVANGQTMEIQSARPRFVSAFEKQLRLLKDAHAVAGWLLKLGRTEIPDADALLPDIAGLERFKTNVLDHWQTVDDLEGLAARDYPLTTADLDQIGPNRRPAAAFYSEQSKPF